MIVATPETESAMNHVPVMAGEVMDLVEVASCGSLLDLTVGAGGHVLAFMARSAPTAKVIACDRDAVALDLARAALRDHADRVRFLHGDSETCCRALLEEGATVQAALLDLGVSSMQLDDEDRGFSLRVDAPLDMRMDKGEERTAGDIVNGSSAEELERILREWGDEPRARRVAEAIVARRRRRPIRTTGDLRVVVEEALGRRGGRIHPATRVFQGLRMAVNREEALLRATLPLAHQLLGPGGRLAVIAFHSGEDRVVKEFMRERERAGDRLLTKRPVTPDAAERRGNRRSRSARLRVLARAGERS